MEILEAFDLTGGLRAAAALAGCDHKTVAHYVALRDAGMAPDERLRRPMLLFCAWLSTVDPATAPRPNLRHRRAVIQACPSHRRQGVPRESSGLSLYA